MKWVDFPLGMRVLLAATVLLFGMNVIYFTAYVVGTAWNIDPGLATLVGGIASLTIMGRQAKLGFNNLIRWEKNQANPESDTRASQPDARERIVLLHGLRAELVSLHKQAFATRHSDLRLAAAYRNFAGTKTTVKRITLASFATPFYDANISRLGLLEASLGADIVTVFSRAKRNEPIDVNAMDASMIATLYDTHAESMTRWAADLYHVATRIRAFEEGTPDPGTLTEQDPRADEDRAKASAGDFCESEPQGRMSI